MNDKYPMYSTDGSKTLQSATQLGVTADEISLLVEKFYEKVQIHPALGPIFSAHINNNWPAHLQKMKSFWRSVLLKTGEYKGKPVPVHLKIAEINTDVFELWLNLFFETTAELFSANTAHPINEVATRIATSLWLSRSSDPFATPPQWRTPNTPNSFSTHQGESP